MIAILQAAFYNPMSQEYTLSGIINVFSSSSSGGLLPLTNSILYATLATIFAILLSFPMAYSSRISLGWLPQINTLLALFPLGVSSITLAYGLMIAIAVPLQIIWPIIVVAQTIIALPFCVKAIESSLQRMDQSLLEQADILGASRFQKLVYIEIPLIVPGIVVGAVFAFAMAIGEMSATLFIARPENYTLAVSIYSYLAARRFVDAGAAALILVSVCVLSFAIINRLSERSIGDVF
jgi:ABC-type Fe3+ transport system permease subunit